MIFHAATIMLVVVREVNSFELVESGVSILVESCAPWLSYVPY